MRFFTKPKRIKKVRPLPNIKRRELLLRQDNGYVEILPTEEDKSIPTEEVVATPIVEAQPQEEEKVVKSKRTRKPKTEETTTEDNAIEKTEDNV